MASDTPPLPDEQKQEDVKRHRSIFDLPVDFFDSCRFLSSPTSSSSSSSLTFQRLSLNDVVEQPTNEDEIIINNYDDDNNKNSSMQRWSCNTCKAEFDSLQDQRSHFKSDFHRLNIKLTIAGKHTIREEDFDETTSDSLCKDYDVSSISGSEDEGDKDIINDMQHGVGRSVKHKLFVQLQTGERISLWKCLLLDDRASILLDDDKFFNKDDGGNYLTESEVTEKLKHVIHETRDNAHLRVVLLARGGHFAGCVFDGNSVVAHKTFHRYVVRAKAGKKQSSKDASGKSIHSAGAALRRYNELALKKDIQELLAAWKSYFASSSSIFIYAPSNNRQLFFDGEKPHFSCHNHAIRNIPLTVRRPTFKEARRIYNILTQISYGVDDDITLTRKEDLSLNAPVTSNSSFDSSKANLIEDINGKEITEHDSGVKNLASDYICESSETASNSVGFGISTPLHDAVKSGNAQKILEFLEQDMDPCAKDDRGRTPYMLATDKELRNTFRRFMASHPYKWDWHAAKVPSALTKEMEESQAAKQAGKDAKKKARAKELKKLRKAREKKAQAEATQAQTTSENYGAIPLASVKQQSQSSSSTKISKEEELKRAQDAEREQRAAAAERRIAALAALRAEGAESSNAPTSSQSKTTETSDILCSCCKASLAGKVPFHRYNYKYCSSTCMHVHKEILEDG